MTSGQFRRYRLNLDIDTLIGGIPKHPEIVRKWQEARWKDSPKLLVGDPQSADEAADRTIDLLGEQVHEDVAGIWTGFVEHPAGGLAMESRQVKAMFKESANIIKSLVRLRAGVMVPAPPKVAGQAAPGGKADSAPPLRARIAERVFPEPKLLQIRDASGAPVEKANGGGEPIERPIHVITALGPRTALKRTDFVEDAQIACDLVVLNDGMITDEILVMILDHAMYNGIGTDRSQGQGTFRYELEELPEDG